MWPFKKKKPANFAKLTIELDPDKVDFRVNLDFSVTGDDQQQALAATRIANWLALLQHGDMDGHITRAILQNESVGGNREEVALFIVRKMRQAFRSIDAMDREDEQYMSEPLILPRNALRGDGQ